MLRHKKPLPLGRGSSRKSLKKDYVFGSKRKLQELNKAICDKLSDKKINRLRGDYKKSLLLPFYSGGDAVYRHGNRKFTLGMENNKIVFVPFRFKNDKYEIEISPNKKWKNYLIRLQNHKSIPITYRLTDRFIYITFDLERLNGFEFKKSEWSKALKEFPKSFKNIGVRKEITKQFYQDQDNRRYKDKIRDRYLAVDLNPREISVVVMDKAGLKVIYKACYNLKKLSKKLKLFSKDLKQVYQNNKRRDEISLIWKDIFKLAVHYKVGNFVVEELKFKPEVLNNSSKSFNRSVKNIWHRNLSSHMINKYCGELGIKLVEVCPAYSSFIGNIKNIDYDPISAALEICRRGINKFERGGFYPKLSRRDKRTMTDLLCGKLGDSIYKTVFGLDSWKQAFALFKQARQRYRRQLCKNIKGGSLKSYKSGVTKYEFCYD